jgi:hypothetical protein
MITTADTATRAAFETDACNQRYHPFDFTLFGLGKVDQVDRTYLDPITEGAWRVWLSARPVANQARSASVDAEISSASRDAKQSVNAWASLSPEEVDHLVAQIIKEQKGRSADAAGCEALMAAAVQKVVERLRPGLPNCDLQAIEAFRTILAAPSAIVPACAASQEADLPGITPIPRWLGSHAALPWSITEADAKKTREIVGADGATVAKLTILDIPNAELIVTSVNAVHARLYVGTVSRLLTEAEAVIGRWHSPKWKDEPHTATFIKNLADAVAEVRGCTLSTPGNSDGFAPAQRPSQRPLPKTTIDAPF